MGNYYLPINIKEMGSDSFFKWLAEQGVEIERNLYKDCLVAHMPCGCNVEISSYWLYSQSFNVPYTIKDILDKHKCLDT